MKENLEFTIINLLTDFDEDAINFEELTAKLILVAKDFKAGKIEE